MLRRLWPWLVVGAVASLAAWLAVQLQYSWQPDDLGPSGHTVVVRYAGLALAGIVLVSAGHRRIFVIPALATYLVPAVLGHRLDLSADIAETTSAHMAIEIALALLPAALLSWVRRGTPSRRTVAPFAWIVGVAACAVAVTTFIEGARPYPQTAETWAGQAIAVSLVVAVVATRPRLAWSVVVVPLLLWHEPVVELLYYSEVSPWISFREYYAFAAWAVACGLVVPIVDLALRAAARAHATSPA